MSRNLCLVCKEIVNELKHLDETFTKCSNSSLRSILENVLCSQIVDLDSSICENCIAVLNEMDLAYTTYKGIQQKILSYFSESDTVPKMCDVCCQTEFLEPEQHDVIKCNEAKRKIPMEFGFEFVDNTSFEFEYENNPLSEEHTCYICYTNFISEDDMITHWKLLHNITIKKNLILENDSDTKKSKSAILSTKRSKTKCNLTKPIIIGDINVSNYFVDEEEESEGTEYQIIGETLLRKCKTTITNDDVKKESPDVNLMSPKFEKPKLIAYMYKCKKCDKTWKREGKWEKHTCGPVEPQPFICEICGQVFKRKPGFTAHRLAHSGEYPYICSVCSKPFSSKASLERHVRIHTGETKYQCDLCGKGFIHNSSFTTHMMLHAGRKDFKCSECGMALFSKTHLERHMRVHTGERPYSCNLCPKAFAERYNLHTHIKVHKKMLLRTF